MENIDNLDSYNSLKLSLLRKIFIASFLVLLIYSGYLLAIEYSKIKDDISKQFNTVFLKDKENFIYFISNKDSEKTEKMVKNLVKEQFIVGAKLTVLFDKIKTFQKGYTLDNNNVLQYDDISLTKRSLIEKLIYLDPHSFSIEHDNNKMGYLTIYNDNLSIISNLFPKLFEQIFASIILSLLITFLSYMVLLRRFIKPFGRLFDSIAKFNFDNPQKSRIKFKKSLTDKSYNQIFSAYNEMIDKIDVSHNTLYQVQDRLKGIINAMPSVLIGLTQHGIVTDWNKHAEKMSGIKEEEAIGSMIQELYHPFTKYMVSVEKALSTKSEQRSGRIKEEKDGETLYYDVYTYPVENGYYAGAVIRIDDVTTIVKLEEIMAQTEKMTAVGGLAAGVAHEINNPLGAVLQGTQNVVRRMDKNIEANRQVANEIGLDFNKFEQYLEQRKILYFIDGISKAGQRAADIVANLLQFSRRSNTTKTVAQLEDLVEKSIKLAAADYNLKKQTDFKHIKIVKEYEENLPAAFCCPIEIEQVIINLLKNAAQAMVAVKDRDPQIIIRIKSLGNNLRLEIEDNGPGIEESIRKRIFEPFFTTKPVGEGTGLGLSVSYNIIVEKHTGAIDLESVPGKGTKFIIKLPTSEMAAYAGANYNQRGDK